MAKIMPSDKRGSVGTSTFQQTRHGLVERVRARPRDPWFFSRVLDVGKVLGKEIGRFDMHDWSIATGEMYGAPPGGPMYQKLLVDYVHYLYGLSR